MLRSSYLFFFFFNDTATTEIYTLSLHDALPISGLDGARRLRAAAEAGPDPAASAVVRAAARLVVRGAALEPGRDDPAVDRKSTRLNSSHANISYAVFCLKKKKKNNSLID